MLRNWLKGRRAGGQAGPRGDQESPRRQPGRRILPNLEPLEDRTLLSTLAQRLMASDFAHQIVSELKTIDTSIHQAAPHYNGDPLYDLYDLPLLGTGLNNQTQLNSTFSNFENQISGWIDPRHVDPAVQLANSVGHPGDIQVTLPLSFTVSNWAPALDLGVGSLVRLDKAAPVVASVKVTWQVQVDFNDKHGPTDSGLLPAGGTNAPAAGLLATLQPSVANPIHVTVDARLTGPGATGQGIEARVSNLLFAQANDAGTHFTGTVDFYLQNAQPQIHLQGNTVIDLNLTAGFTNPRLTAPAFQFDLLAEFQSSWAYDNLKAEDTSKTPQPAGNAIQKDVDGFTSYNDLAYQALLKGLSFNNVAIQAGFISQLLGPVIADIKKVTDNPVMESLLHLLQIKIPILGKTIEDLLPTEAQVALAAIDFINDFAPGPDGTANIPLGNFHWNGNTQNDLSNLVFDPTKPPADFKADPPQGPDPIDQYATQVSQDVPSNLVDPATVKKLFQRDNPSQGFHFPLLETPATAFELLLGQNTDLVTFTMPALNALTLTLPPVFGINLFGVINANLTGFFTVGLNLTAGYDTQGLKDFFKSGNLGDLAGGVYVGTGTVPAKPPSLLNPNPKPAHPATGITVTAKIGLTAGADAKVVGASAEVDIGGTVSLGIANLDGSDKQEKRRLFGPSATLTLDNLFTPSGSIFVEASVKAQLFGHTIINYDTGQIVLVSFGGSGSSGSGGNGGSAQPPNTILIDPTKAGSDPTKTTVVKAYEDRIVPTTMENPGGPNLPPVPTTELEAGIEVDYPDGSVNLYPEFRYSTQRMLSDGAVRSFNLIDSSVIPTPISYDLIATNGPLGNAGGRVLVEDPFHVWSDLNPIDPSKPGISPVPDPTAGKPHLVVLVGGQGDDDLEFTANDGTHGQGAQDIGQAMLIGGGGNNKLVGGVREYGNWAINDPSTTDANGLPTGEDAVAVLDNDLHFADLGLPTQNPITSMVQTAEQPPPLFTNGNTLDSGGNFVAPNDTLIGTAGNDVLIGGPGSNLIDGRTGTDRLYGEMQLYGGNFKRIGQTTFMVDIGPSGTFDTQVFADHTSTTQNSLILTHDGASDGQQGGFAFANPDTAPTITLTASSDVYVPRTVGATGGVNIGNVPGLGTGPASPPPPPPAVGELAVENAGSYLLVEARGIQLVSVIEDPASQDSMHVTVDTAALSKTEVTNVHFQLSHTEDAPYNPTHTNTVTVLGAPGGGDTLTLQPFLVTLPAIDGAAPVTTPWAQVTSKKAPKLTITLGGVTQFKPDGSSADLIVLDGQGAANDTYSIAPTSAGGFSDVQVAHPGANNSVVLDAHAWDHGQSQELVLASLSGGNVALQEFNSSNTGFGFVQRFNLSLAGRVNDLAVTVAGTEMSATINDPTQAATIHVLATSTLNDFHVLHNQSSSLDLHGTNGGTNGLRVDQNSGTITFNGGGGKGGSAEADLGTAAHSLSNIGGTLKLYNPNGTMVLKLDDSQGNLAGNGYRQLTVTAEQVFGLQAFLYFDPTQLTEFDLNLNRTPPWGGDPAVVINVPDDPTLYFRQLSQFNVNSNGLVTVKALARTPLGALYVNGDGRQETDLEVTNFPAVVGNIKVSNARVLHLTDSNAKDVSGGTFGTRADDRSNFISGLTRGLISYQAVAYLTVDAPTAWGASFTVQDTPAQTVLNVGASGVTVNGTTKQLLVEAAQNGILRQTVNASSRIKGQVVFEKSSKGGAADVVVNAADPAFTGKNVTLSNSGVLAGGVIYGSGFSRVSGMTPTDVYADASATLALVVQGTGANTFTVNDTPAATTSILAPAGTVNVLGTTGTLFVNTGGTVDLGASAGSVQGLHGDVSVSGILLPDGSQHSAALLVDDHKDTNPHGVTLAPQFSFFTGQDVLTGLSRGTIHFNVSQPGQQFLTAIPIRSLSVTAGTGKTSFTVQSDGTEPITLQGANVSNVDVTSSMGILAVNGAQLVRIGLGSVANIKGQIIVGPGAQPGQTAVQINDFNDTAAHQVKIGPRALLTPLLGLSQADVLGLAPAPIQLDLGSLSSLKILTGSGSDTYAIVDLKQFVDDLGGTNYPAGPYLSGLNLTIQSSAGPKTLVGPNLTNDWELTDFEAGTLDGTIQFSGMTTLVGGSGDDAYHFRASSTTSPNPLNPTQQIPVRSAGFMDAIDGGAGTNTLDFSGLLVPTDVSLEDQRKIIALAVASGVSGQYTGTRYNGLTQQTANLVGAFYDISGLTGNAGSTLDTGMTGFGKPFLFDNTLPRDGATSFTATVTASGFDNASLHFWGDFSGKLLAPTLGTAANPVTSIQIDGAMTAGSVLEVNYLGTLLVGVPMNDPQGNLTVTGDLAGTVKAFGSGITNPAAANNPGFGIAAPPPGNQRVNDSFVIGSVHVGGSLTPTGSITALTIGFVTIDGDRLGTITDAIPTA